MSQISNVSNPQFYSPQSSIHSDQFKSIQEQNTIPFDEKSITPTKSNTYSNIEKQFYFDNLNDFKDQLPINNTEYFRQCRQPQQKETPQSKTQDFGFDDFPQYEDNQINDIEAVGYDSYQEMQQHLDQRKLQVLPNRKQSRDLNDFDDLMNAKNISNIKQFTQEFQKINETDKYNYMTSEQLPINQLERKVVLNTSEIKPQSSKFPLLIEISPQQQHTQNMPFACHINQFQNEQNQNNFNQILTQPQKIAPTPHFVDNISNKIQLEQIQNNQNLNISDIYSNPQKSLNDSFPESNISQEIRNSTVSKPQLIQQQQQQSQNTNYSPIQSLDFIQKTQQLNLNSNSEKISLSNIYKNDFKVQIQNDNSEFSLEDFPPKQNPINYFIRNNNFSIPNQLQQQISKIPQSPDEPQVIQNPLQVLEDILPQPDSQQFNQFDEKYSEQTEPKLQRQQELQYINEQQQFNQQYQMSCQQESLKSQVQNSSFSQFNEFQPNFPIQIQISHQNKSILSQGQIIKNQLQQDQTIKVSNYSQSSKSDSNQEKNNNGIIQNQNQKEEDVDQKIEDIYQKISHNSQESCVYFQREDLNFQSEDENFYDIDNNEWDKSKEIQQVINRESQNFSQYQLQNVENLQYIKQQQQQSNQQLQLSQQFQQISIQQLKLLQQQQELNITPRNQGTNKVSVQNENSQENINPNQSPSFFSIVSSNSVSEKKKNNPFEDTEFFKDPQWDQVLPQFDYQFEVKAELKKSLEPILEMQEESLTQSNSYAVQNRTSILFQDNTISELQEKSTDESKIIQSSIKVQSQEISSNQKEISIVRDNKDCIKEPINTQLLMDQLIPGLHKIIRKSFQQNIENQLSQLASQFQQKLQDEEQNNFDFYQIKEQVVQMNNLVQGYGKRLEQITHRLNQEKENQESQKSLNQNQSKSNFCQSQKLTQQQQKQIFSPFELNLDDNFEESEIQSVQYQNQSDSRINIVQSSQFNETVQKGLIHSWQQTEQELKNESQIKLNLEDDVPKYLTNYQFQNQSLKRLQEYEIQNFRKQCLSEQITLLDTYELIVTLTTENYEIDDIQGYKTIILFKNKAQYDLQNLIVQYNSNKINDEYIVESEKISKQCLNPGEIYRQKIKFQYYDIQSVYLNCQIKYTINNYKMGYNFNNLSQSQRLQGTQEYKNLFISQMNSRNVIQEMGQFKRNFNFYIARPANKFFIYNYITKDELRECKMKCQSEQFHSRNIDEMLIFYPWLIKLDDYSVGGKLLIQQKNNNYEFIIKVVVNRNQKGIIYMNGMDMDQKLTQHFLTFFAFLFSKLY